MTHLVRRLRAVDVPRILQIQGAAYASHLLEEGDVFEDKLSDAPDYCLGVEQPGGELLAYVIALPMNKTASIGLHEETTSQVDVNGPILYVHDMAVHPRAHGTGMGRALLDALESVGRGNGQETIELVAIESAVGYWAGHGFEKTDDAVFEGYGPGARKMRRSL